jgi:hypothetical protein
MDPAWRLAFEFLAQGANALGQDAGDFVVDRLLVDESKIQFVYSGVPKGRRDAGPNRWTPDRPLLIEVLERTYACRSTRMDRDTGIVAPPRKSWRDVLIEDYQPRFGKGSHPDVGDGWCDLLRAICETYDAHAVPAVFTQIKEKFGRLCVYNDGVLERALDIKLSAGLLSTHICETCGRPGKLRRGSWWKTACEEHVRG